MIGSGGCTAKAALARSPGGDSRKLLEAWSTASIVVTSRSHATGARVLAVVRARFQYDDHANPALYLRTDGRLLVMWSGHMGGRMYYRVSTRPRDE